MFHSRTSRIAATLALLSTAALPQTGFAASYLDSVPRGVTTSYSASLADLSGQNIERATKTLDWRQPSLEFQFDLPPSERTSEIILTLSADPLTRVAPNAPLQVQFNGGKPVPVLSNGRGFEARLPLDARQSRSRRNTIRISYPTPTGAECVAPIHGAWSVDLASSNLLMKGRAKSRHMSLTEVSNTFEIPFLSPKTVGLIARGPSGTDMQALAAQAVSLRTPGVPNFSVTTQNTDFNIVMVKRERLFDVTNDPMILNSKGARVFVPRGRPTELIFTADTDAEIVKMLELFATRKLPNTRRSISSLGELNLQTYLGGGAPKIEGKTPLLDIAAPSPNTAAGTQSYSFSVSNPLTTSGQLLLRLSSADDLDENSRLLVSLNGETLGAAKLDKKRKSVGFDIKPGAMKAHLNRLTLTSDVKANSDFTCPTQSGFTPSFSIGDGSRLTLSKAATSPVTELSNLTASAGLFAEAESYIVLPRQTRDYQAALRVLGRLAKSSGQGLTSADYTRKTDVARDKHILVIGPSKLAKNHLQGAPKALLDAISGQSSTGNNLLQASFERSVGVDDTALRLAAAQTAAQKINRGGIAALYSAGNGKLTGVISAAPGSSFIQASKTLVQPGHWNALQGGVARWNSSSVVMAQTAQSDKGIQLPKPKSGFDFPDLGLSGIDSFDLRWPDVNWPDFDMPQVGLPKFSWPSFKSDKRESAAKPAVMRRDVAPIKADTAILRDLGQPEKSVKVVNVTPRLKPQIKTVESRSTNSASGLRGAFKFPADTQPSRSSFADIRRETKAKWSATKRWVKTKTEAVTQARTLDDMARATDRLQDRVEPAGRSMKATLKNKLPGKGLVQLGDRTVSVYGLILIMAFAFVLLMMSLSGPTSRLGGRH